MCQAQELAGSIEELDEQKKARELLPHNLSKTLSTNLKGLRLDRTGIPPCESHEALAEKASLEQAPAIAPKKNQLADL